MRGKGIQQRNCWVTMRITPACAGKRRALPRSQPALGDHPRVCGEKVTTASPEGGRRGSPPRVRGKVSCHCWITPQLGITPACAGKRLCYPFFLSPLWDHPRVCGEKSGSSPGSIGSPGSPPRVRGKAALWRVSRPLFRITPACAGKSLGCAQGLTRAQDHPRVCGEKCQPGPRSPGWAGSPPRVRGKARSHAQLHDDAGITPACAGKRALPAPPAGGSWDHPRVCGEKRVTPSRWTQRQGSPPRVRGKALSVCWPLVWIRITPACAGKSDACRPVFPLSEDHPRVCGEKLRKTAVSVRELGSPPRVRGKGVII